MSRFDSRINALVRHTHNFISNEDYSLILEYFRARFDEEKKPDDFEEKRKEMIRLEREYDPIENPGPRQQFDEIINSSVALRLSCLIQFFEEEFRKYPRGSWHAKWYSHGFVKLITDAKAYLKSTKKDEQNQAKSMS